MTAEADNFERLLEAHALLAAAIALLDNGRAAAHGRPSRPCSPPAFSPD
jgi:hypothetical protein